MNKDIDCLFIGNNRGDFAEYEKSLRKMDKRSGAYRDLNFSFITYDNRPYSGAQVYNTFCCGDISSGEAGEPIDLDEDFSAAIAYLGTFLDRRGFTFDYVNSFQDEKELLAEKLTHQDIRVVAIITTLYVTALPILEIMDFIKQHNPTAAVVVGGPFISNKTRTLDPDGLEYLFKSIDADYYVNSAQGEESLVQLLQALKQEQSPSGVPNIYYKTSQGYVSTSTQTENTPLDSNMVDWELFSSRVKRYINTRTSISCPFSCAFCGFPEHAGKYQTANVEIIEKELQALDRIEAVQNVYFIDDTFNVPVKRFKEILRMMVKNRFKFQWHSHFRVQFADRETVELMKQSGCRGVFLGIESGNSQILKNMNKAATVERYLQGIQLLKEFEIPTFGSFIIGFPGETEETVADTLRFIEEGGLDFFRTQLWYCDPITPIFREKDKYRIQGESFEWSHQTMDSKTAADIIENIFLTVDKPVWVPQHNFDFDSLLKLIAMEIPLDIIKEFLRAFNNGVREKLMHPERREVSVEHIMRVKNVFTSGNPVNETVEDAAGLSADDEAQFDF